MATKKPGAKAAPKKLPALPLPDAWKPPDPLPDDLGECINLYLKVREERDARKAKVKEAEREMTRVEEHVIHKFDVAAIKAIATKLGRVKLDEKDVPQIKDYEAFCAYIAETGGWDLIQRRPGEKACQARWEAGIQIPGVEKYHTKKLSTSES